jgi:predicted acylesterase/phospholipase RssA
MTGGATGPGARDAVVLSGGGARGAYEIGVMRALLTGAASSTGGAPVAARIFTGTSVGSYNAAFMAQHENPDAAVLERLEAIWRERIAGTLANCGNGVYRLRADPTRWLDPGCLRDPLRLFAETARDGAFWGGYALAYGTQLLAAPGPWRVKLLESFNLAALFSRDPLERLLAETIDLARLRASPNELAVTVADWSTGKVRTFSKSEVTERFGTDAILASTAIPGIFPPVPIDGSPCVDGGLLMNTPTKPAIKAGADVLHVIYVDPMLSDIPFPDLPNTLDTFYRLYTILLAVQVEADVRHAAIINEELAALAAAGGARGSQLPAVRARRLVARRRAGETVSRPDKIYWPLVIHRYRPQTDLGGAEAFLDFSPAVVDLMIRQGYADAVAHDCGDAGCVWPPAGAELPALARRRAEPVALGAAR